MQTALPEETLTSGEPTPSDRLDSWKEIAAYFRRDVRTVRRWERSLGLPVHRHRQRRGVSVYAYKGEVDDWWKRRDGAAGDGTPVAETTDHVSAPLGWVAVALLATLGLLHSDMWRPRSPDPSPDPGAVPFSSSTYPAGAEYPSLSPDARQWVFSWDGGSGGNLDIYRETVGEKREGRVQLTTNPAADFNPTWSPDGLSIAFIRQRVAGEFQVMVLPAAGGEERSIATCQAEWDRHAGSYLAWTPDGRGLMVLQRELDGQTAGLLLVPPAEGPVRRLVLPLDGSHVPRADAGGHFCSTEG